MLLEAINKAKKITIVGHIGPDADSLGSVTGLAQSLRLIDKKVTTICVDPVPEHLRFLYGSELLTDEIDEDVDLLFMLDTSTNSRLGPAGILYEKAATTVLIDHHISNDMTADIEYIVRDASSTGEILYTILKENNLPIDKNIANSIMTAISGDTGSFRYDNVSKDTFIIASELLEHGADLGLINNNLYGSNRIQKLEMLSLAMERMVYDEKKQAAISYVTREDFEKLDALISDLEGIVETIRDIKGVEISILLRPSKYEGIKASGRSKTNYDIRKLAEKFGGGGHTKAAGFSMDTEDYKKAIEIIIDQI